MQKPHNLNFGRCCFCDTSVVISCSPSESRKAPHFVANLWQKKSWSAVALGAWNAGLLCPHSRHFTSAPAEKANATNDILFENTKLREIRCDIFSFTVRHYFHRLFQHPGRKLLLSSPGGVEENTWQGPMVSWWRYSDQSLVKSVEPKVVST